MALSSAVIEVALNAAIFSMFFAMISSELMAASAIIFRYEESVSKVFKFLVPIWEVTGTFFVFYAVNIEALVPDALPFIAYTFTPYILVFLILYIGRNSSIISAEYIWKNRIVDRKMLYRIYAIVTYALGIMILIIYTAVISGSGVGFSSNSFSLYSFISFLPDDGFIIGSAIILFGLASVFYDLDVKNYLPFAVMVLGMLIAAPSLIALNDLTDEYLLIPAGILTIFPAILRLFPGYRSLASNKLLVQALLASSSFLIIFSAYPWILGRSLNITTLLNSSVMQQQIFYTTIIGGILLLIMTIVFFRVFSRASERGRMPEMVSYGLRIFSSSDLSLPVLMNKGAKTCTK